MGERECGKIAAEYDISMSSGFIIIEKNESFEVPDYIETMLLHNDIRGFLRFGIKEVDNKKSFVYDISSKTSLEKICSRKRLNADMIRRLMEGIFMVLNECGRYLLTEEDIILKSEYIFFEGEEDLSRISVCYYPGYGRRVKDRLNELLGELINYLDYKDKEAVTLLYALYSKTGEESCTTGQLMKILNEGVEKREQNSTYEYEEKDERSVEKVRTKSTPPDNFFGKIKSLFVRSEEADKSSMNAMLRERTVLLSDFSLLHKFKLVSTDGNESVYVDKTPFYIGKKENSMDLTIREDTISRIHARLTLERNSCYLEDLNSTNGTFINGSRLKQGIREKLEEGDVIAFSEKQYVFETAKMA